MNVTDLRKVLQALEARGLGGVEVAPASRGVLELTGHKSRVLVTRELISHVEPEIAAIVISDGLRGAGPLMDSRNDSRNSRKAES